MFAVVVDHAVVLRDRSKSAASPPAWSWAARPRAERDEAIVDFRAGRLRALVNVGVLTTGFDAPELDLLAVARPTASTALHVQMLGRGTRIADGKADCLVLDFAGNVQRLGPITAPRVQASQCRAVATVPTVKVCPKCDAYLAPAARRCEHCGYGYPAPPERTIGSNFGDVDPLYAHPVPVETVTYSAHYKPGRPPSLRISYRLAGRWLSEWLCLFHPGFIGERARAEWRRRGGIRVPVDINDAVRQAQALRRPPAVVVSDINGFTSVIPIWN